MMTNRELVAKVRIIKNRNNGYNNVYPRNLCYFDGDKITADCWNLIKSLIWQPDICNNYTMGRFANPDFSTGLGDLTGEQIYEKCTVRSNDFSKAPPGAFLIYSDGSHAGIVSDTPGKALEMTVGWGANGIVESDIGPHGERTLNGQQIGYWRAWGKMPWINYVESDISVGDIVRLKSGVNKDIHGTYLNVAYLNSQTLSVYSLNNDIAALINKDKGWLEVEMFVNDIEKVTTNESDKPEEDIPEEPTKPEKPNIPEEPTKPEKPNYIFKKGSIARGRLWSSLDFIFNDLEVDHVDGDLIHLIDGRVFKAEDLKLIK